jgi:tetraacyldisaccharide 4'-kinase
MPNRTLESIERFAIDVILERRYGKRAFFLRLFLGFLAFFYEGIMRLRLWAYENRYLPWENVGCLVVSVGNLTVGGTGKTPVVEKISKTLNKAGRRVAILSRGYKSKPKPWMERMVQKYIHGQEDIPRVVSDGRSLLLDSERGGDEPFMLASNLRGVPVIVDKNRIKSALYGIKHFGIDTVVLDDGFQYMSIKERINIALVDREAPFGNRSMLPRGTLREPKDHLKRADVIFITKCNGEDLTELKAEIRKYNKHAEILECKHHPLYIEEISTGERKDLSFLKGMRVGSVCGIAVPESFEGGLKRMGAEIVYSRYYADHHRFNKEEIDNAIERTHARAGEILMTTEKDAVRFPRVQRNDIPIYFLRMEIDLLNSQETLEDCILRICRIKKPEEAKEYARSK